MISCYLKFKDNSKNNTLFQECGQIKKTLSMLSLYKIIFITFKLLTKEEDSKSSKKWPYAYLKEHLSSVEVTIKKWLNWLDQSIKFLHT